MEINKSIRFETLQNTLIISKGEKGYNELKKVNTEGNWTDYINEMLKNKISVRYDFLTDTFIVVPIERQLKENFNFTIDDDYNEEPTINVVGVDDVKNIFQDLVDQQITPKIKDGFEKLRNEIYTNISTTTANEQILNSKDISLIQNSDDELFLPNYEYTSAFDNEIIFRTEPEYDDYIHPDFQRIMGNRFKVAEPQNVNVEPEKILFDQEQPEQQIEQELMSIDKEVNLNGKRVTLVLSGVLITESELKFIAEQAEKYNLNLKEIKGEGDKLDINVVNEHKQLKTINIIDSDLNPFCVDNIKFKNLHEALNYSRKDLQIIEKNTFKGILRESVKPKYKETLTIINDNVQTWRVYNLGNLNLKNGENNSIDNILKESAFTNITKYNTLLKNKSGDYILLSGTLNERSEVGKKAFITESKLRKPKDLGVYEVVGKYENTLEGLGEVMYETKQTSVNLFYWA